jgi:hypothetical protein
MIPQVKFNMGSYAGELRVMARPLAYVRSVMLVAAATALLQRIKQFIGIEVANVSLLAV